MGSVKVGGGARHERGAFFVVGIASFFQVGLPAVLTLGSEGHAYCIANPFALCAVACSERVHVRQVGQREASGRVGSCNRNLASEQDSRFVRWATHFVLRRAPARHAPIMHHPKKGIRTPRTRQVMIDHHVRYDNKV